MRLDFSMLRIPMLVALSLIYSIAMMYVNIRSPGGFSTLSYMPLGIFVFLLLYSIANTTERRIVIEYDGAACRGIPMTKKYFYNAMNLTRLANNKLFAIKDLAVSVYEIKETLAKALLKEGWLGLEEEITYAIGYFSQGEWFVGGDTKIIGDTRNPKNLVMRHDYDMRMNDAAGLFGHDEYRDRVMLYEKGRWTRELSENLKDGIRVKILALTRSSAADMFSEFSSFSKKSAGLLFLMLDGRIVVGECFI